MRLCSLIFLDFLLLRVCLVDWILEFLAPNTMWVCNPLKAVTVPLPSYEVRGIESSGSHPPQHFHFHFHFMIKMRFFSSLCVINCLHGFFFFFFLIHIYSLGFSFSAEKLIYFGILTSNEIYMF